jgi:hypothetical protein
MVMMIAVVWLGFIGGGDTQLAALAAISITAIWMVIGFAYYYVNSRSRPSGIFPFPGKESPNDEKHSISAS